MSLTLEAIPTFDRRTLQKHCKALGIKANSKSDILREELEKHVLSQTTDENVDPAAGKSSSKKNEEKSEKHVSEKKSKSDALSEQTTECPSTPTMTQKTRADSMEELLGGMESMSLNKITRFDSPESYTPEHDPYKYKVHWTMKDYKK